jgi:ParB-like chromosome segregation protein Spo0J
MAKEALISVARLIEDMDIYPRVAVDDYHTNEIAEAIRAGRQMPPLKVGRLPGQKSYLIIDGVHRRRAFRKIHGDNVKVPVIIGDYANKEMMILEAVEANAHHGRSLTMQDKVRCILMLEKSYAVAEISRVLGLTVEKVGVLRVERTARHNEEGVALKLTTSHMAGMDLTKDQMHYQKGAGGLHQSFYVNQVIAMLESDAVEWKNQNLVALLGRLKGVLKRESRIQ